MRWMKPGAGCLGGDAGDGAAASATAGRGDGGGGCGCGGSGDTRGCGALAFKNELGNFITF